MSLFPLQVRVDLVKHLAHLHLLSGSATDWLNRPRGRLDTDNRTEYALIKIPLSFPIMLTSVQLQTKEELLQDPTNLQTMY